MFIESIEAISTGVTAIDLSQKIFPSFQKIIRRIVEGKITIVIFGAAGTGKTTLAKLLSGRFASSELLPPYQESIGVESYQLDSDVIASVIVAPGQERREDSWDDCLRLINSGKVRLVINIVSWGYHSFREISYQQHRLYQDNMTVAHFLEEYTQDCRQREINVLEKIKESLSLADQKQTILITLVTKQDLWWNNRQTVKQYYYNGEYKRIIEKITNKKGSANFTHEYTSACLVYENFISGTNELLISTTPGYDQRIKFTNFQSFISILESHGRLSLKGKNRL